MIYDEMVHLGLRRIGLDQPTYFIADIAANHDGDLERAKDLIYLAKESGADCAKFQHFLASEIVSDYGFQTLGNRQGHQASWKKSVFDVYKDYECRREWTDELIATCQRVGIDFMTTPYDFEAVKDFSSKVTAYKVGSGDITWTELLREIASIGKPIMLATGAASMFDVERAVNEILKYNRQIVLMQCNTNYTAAAENYSFINLNVLRSYALRWPGMVLGLSDHTIGHSTVLGAVALGARVIEKHFTDDNSRSGPDHYFAMNPLTWKEMVIRSRELEQALGDGIKRVEGNENETFIIQRRSIRALKSLAVGTVLSRDDLKMLRPCPPDGIEPWQLSLILGKRLTRSVSQGEHLRWSDLR